MFRRNLLKSSAFRALLFCLQLPLTVVAGEMLPYTGIVDAQFRLADLTDQEHSLIDYRGKVVVVNFWASWCPPCIYEMPALARLKKQLADQPFEILALNVGEKKYRVLKFVKLINFDLPVLLDTSRETFDQWGVKTLPTSFLIGADGRVRYRVQGDPDWEDENTLATLEKLLSEAAGSNAGRTTITDTNINNTNDKKAPQ
jgi:thiol-disulfide isomerase/thioredoxin